MTRQETNNERRTSEERHATASSQPLMAGRTSTPRPAHGTARALPARFLEGTAWDEV